MVVNKKYKKIISLEQSLCSFAFHLCSIPLCFYIIFNNFSVVLVKVERGVWRLVEFSHPTENVESSLPSS